MPTPHCLKSYRCRLAFSPDLEAGGGEATDVDNTPVAQHHKPVCTQQRLGKGPLALQSHPPRQTSPPRAGKTPVTTPQFRSWIIPAPISDATMQAGPDGSEHFESRGRRSGGRGKGKPTHHFVGYAPLDKLGGPSAPPELASHSADADDMSMSSSCSGAIMSTGGSPITVATSYSPVTVPAFSGAHHSAVASILAAPTHTWYAHDADAGHRAVESVSERKMRLRMAMEGKVCYPSHPPAPDAEMESCWPTADEWSYTSPERANGPPSDAVVLTAPFKLSATAQPFTPRNTAPFTAAQPTHFLGDEEGDSGLWVEKGCYAIASSLTPPLTRSLQRCK